MTRILIISALIALSASTPVYASDILIEGVRGSKVVTYTDDFQKSVKIDAGEVAVGTHAEAVEGAYMKVQLKSGGSAWVRSVQMKYDAPSCIAANAATQRKVTSNTALGAGRACK